MDKGNIHCQDWYEMFAVRKDDFIGDFMGLIGAIKSMFRTTEEAAEVGNKITGGVINALDALHYSPEEKAQHVLTFINAQTAFLKETAGSALSRRVLAFGTMGMFFFVILLCLVFFPIELYLIHHYEPALLSSETLMKLLGNFDTFMLRYAPVTYFYLTIIKQIYTLVLMVMGTYFVYHGVTKMFKK